MNFYIENVSAHNRDVYVRPNIQMLETPYCATSVEYKVEGDSSWTNHDFTEWFEDDPETGDGHWESVSLTIRVPAGGRVYFRGSNSIWSGVGEEYDPETGEPVGNILDTLQFGGENNSGDEYAVGGDIRTLLDYENYSSISSLDDSVFYGLFGGFTKLTDASDLSLPATTLADNCYSNMFNGCTSLTSAPTLPATTLASHCYQVMFSRCTSLTTAPSLPATTLANDCYNGMFANCTSLTTAPALPATTLAFQCYKEMFLGCSSLNEVTVYADDNSAGFCTTAWLGNVANSGTFYNNGSATYPTNSDDGIPTGWTEVGPTPAIDYFYIENTYNGQNTVTLTTTGSGASQASSVEYSKDQSTWTTLTLTAGGTNTITLNQGEKVYFRNDSGMWNSGGGNYTTFTANQSHIVGGNVNTLIDYTDLNNITLANYCFYKLFNGNSNLTSASNLSLPSTTLAQSCYYSMFMGCTSLTTAPTLPATNLQSNCYNNMFYGCTSLTTAPTLPATTLANYCYSSMFSRCTSLTAAPSLPATTLARSCYNYMFSGCTSLTAAPSLPATTLAQECYGSMFSGCNHLTTAPALPATTLAQSCYGSMFSGCTSLTTAPALPATTLAQSCYYSMFSGCTSLTTAPALPATTLAQECYNIMFSGCTSLTTAPTLPATTLANYCYYSMFYNCTSLTSAPSLPATTLAVGCYYGMFMNCTSLTTAPTLPATTLAQSCYNSMFSGCTALNEVTTYANDISASNCLNYWLNNVSNSGTLYNNGSATYTPNSSSGIPTGWTEVLPSKTITATAGSNGSISPSGAVSVNVGSDQTFTFTPDTGYEVDTVTVDGSTVTPTNNTYTFTNVQADHTISVTFKVQTYTITATAGSNGSISPSGAVTVNVGASQTFTVTPDTGYIVDTLTVDGSTATLTNDTYTFSNVQSDHTISVTFKLPDLTDYFYIENTYNGQNTVTLTTTGSGASQASSVEYSKDKNSWTTLTLTAGGTNTITLETGEKVYFRNDSGKWSSGSSNYTAFTANQSHIVGGNVNTLLDYTDLNNITLPKYCFYYLFMNDNNLTSASSLSLPSTTLAERCYRGMFSGCTSLTTAPSLPATTLAQECYMSMFQDCTSLTTAPTLPATTLATYCYTNMFYGCTSLTSTPTLPATRLVNSCYYSMFKGCTSLTTAPVLPVTTLAVGCYHSMFQDCTSLTTAPTLPATTLARDCYANMFSGCRALTSAPTLSATTLAESCYREMFNICTSLTTAPSLPATTLARYCYSNMFNGCTSLNSVTTYADDITATDCISYWLNNVAATGTFHNNGSATYTVDSASGIPVGWTEVLPSKTITATAGQNGSISPSGSVSVNVGSDQTFTFTPDTGYEVDTVTVDGSTVTPTNNTYTFTNVQADHTISVTFKVQTFTINAISEGHTTVNPSGLVTVNYGASQTFTFSPIVGYELDKLYIDGVETAFSGSSYTFTNVQADHTLEITSKLRTFTIEATYSEGGEISPDGTVTVEYDDDATFEVTPSTGYLLWELLVDGVDKKDELVDNTYTFENVTANHTIHAVFDDIYLIVSVTSGPNGTITPTGDVEVIYNGYKIFTITPNEGYEVDTLLLDGTDVTDEIEDFNYTLTNVVENHTLEVTFKEKVIPTTNGFNFDQFKNRDYVKQYKK